MKRIVTLIVAFVFMSIAQAGSRSTNRHALISNHRVAVWQTTISADKNHVLQFHRHEHDRVVIALTDGLLKITNDQGKIHYMKLEKNQAYFLKKDVPNELHKDENITKKIVQVIVVELMT